MTIASVDQLIQLQLELQSIPSTSNGPLTRRPELDPDEISRVLIVQHNGNRLIFLPHELPSYFRERLEEFARETASPDLLTIIHWIANQLPGSQVRGWRTCIFPDSLTPADYPDAVALSGGRPVPSSASQPELESESHTAFGILVEGQVVSTCRSIRENVRAAEAWVCTLPAWRKRGYGRQVTAAWAHSLQKRCRVPFYSYVPENRAAQALAQSLGLVHVFDLIEWDCTAVVALP